jgi:hypothetical protein
MPSPAIYPHTSPVVSPSTYVHTSTQATKATTGNSTSNGVSEYVQHWRSVLRVLHYTNNILDPTRTPCQIAFFYYLVSDNSVQTQIMMQKSSGYSIPSSIAFFYYLVSDNSVQTMMQKVVDTPSHREGTPRRQNPPTLDHHFPTAEKIGSYRDPAAPQVYCCCGP